MNLRKKCTAILAVVCAAALVSGAGPIRKPLTADMVYLGVKDYGKENVDTDHKDDFLYRFDLYGREKIFSVDNGKKDAEGAYAYPIQNQLKEGSRYRLTIERGTVTAVKELKKEQAAYVPVVQGTAGERTLANFLRTALMPVGTTLYIYGGGWDWQDVGSAVNTRTLGVSPDWVTFFNEQDENYTYRDQDGDSAKADPEHSYYPYGAYNEYHYAGLDCSGYLGWTLYNTLETENGRDGYVGGSTGFAKRLAGMNLGTWTQDIRIPDGKNGYVMKPGDVMSINGHVWISLGTCEDGSVVILHSTPSMSHSGQPGGGVQIGAVGRSRSCAAYQLAEKYMTTYYPAWCDRYPVHLCDPDVYFSFTGENAGRFSWDTTDGETGLADPEGLQEKGPEEVLVYLFTE